MHLQEDFHQPFSPYTVYSVLDCLYPMKSSANLHFQKLAKSIVFFMKSLTYIFKQIFNNFSSSHCLQCPGSSLSKEVYIRSSFYFQPTKQKNLQMFLSLKILIAVFTLKTAFLFSPGLRRKSTELGVVVEGAEDPDSCRHLKPNPTINFFINWTNYSKINRTVKTSFIFGQREP